MSNSGRVQHSKGKLVQPEPLPLTRNEAETLRGAVHRIIRASEASGLTRERPEKKKSAPR